MIKDEISEMQSRLSFLKERYKDLVEKIKDVLYEHEVYLDKTSKKKPKCDKDIMSAAYSIVIGSAPHHKYDLNINRAKLWNKGKSDHETPLDFWYVYSDRFKDFHGTTSPVIVLHKKHLKSIDKDYLIKAWASEVSVDRSRPNTTLGFNDWIKEVSIDDLFDILSENMKDRVEIISEKSLGVKDIVVILPVKVIQHGIY